MKHPLHTPFALIELEQPSSHFLAKTTPYQCNKKHNQGFGVQHDNFETTHLALHI
jgi:hypothetical protein